MSKTKSVAQVLLDVLADAGARDIFGVTGDALNTLLEAIRHDDRFQWFGVRHEENAAYAAYAQAEISGGIGVCAGTVGPGSLHLINGLYNAKREGAGVVAITGQVARVERGTGYFQEVDLTKAFDDICSYQAVIESPGAGRPGDGDRGAEGAGGALGGADRAARGRDRRGDGRPSLPAPPHPPHPAPRPRGQ